MKILITGFEPFGGEEMNPSYEAVKNLPDQIEGVEVIKMQIPTTFEDSMVSIERAIEKYNPEVVLNIGQAANRYGITIERVAINLIDSKIPDNKGEQPVDQVIKEDGENAYFTNLPVKEIVQNIKSAGIPAAISYTAGTYVCNYVFYQNMYACNKGGIDRKIGFIHVPYATIQGANKNIGVPTMSIRDMTEALEITIKTIIQ